MKSTLYSPRAGTWTTYPSIITWILPWPGLCAWKEEPTGRSSKSLAGGFVPGIIGISITLINALERTGLPACQAERGGQGEAGGPGRIPAQSVANTLFYFTNPGDLVFAPMAGGGVVPDTCLAFNRKYWSFDLVDRPETRPEIEPHQCKPENLLWPVKAKEKPDLIFFDPPYFNKLAIQYTKDSISSLSRKEYLGFFREFFPLAKENSKSKARIAFLNADWRDFQGVSALSEDPGRSILLWDYMNILNR